MARKHMWGEVLTKKWSPPEIQECDLWQGNICGVRCMSLWSMINGHTTPIFSKIAMNDHFQKNGDRKSTRLNSSHSQISYAVFCLKKKKKKRNKLHTLDKLL